MRWPDGHTGLRCHSARSLACAVCLAGAGCRTPTQITLEVTTDVSCADLQGTAISVAAPDALESAAAVAVASACDPSGRVGSLVVVPSADNDVEIAVRIVSGHKRSNEACVPPAMAQGAS
jgi:hypothetical protein